MPSSSPSDARLSLGRATPFKMTWIRNRGHRSLPLRYSPPCKASTCSRRTRESRLRSGASRISSSPTLQTTPPPRPPRLLSPRHRWTYPAASTFRDLMARLRTHPALRRPSPCPTRAAAPTPRGPSPSKRKWLMHDELLAQTLLLHAPGRVLADEGVMITPVTVRWRWPDQ